MKQLDADLLTCNFNSGMFMSVVSDENSIIASGNFYKRSDFGAMFYETTDVWGKHDGQYTTNTDLSSIILDYDFVYSGLPPIGDGPLAPTLTVRYIDGTEKYIRLYNYQTTSGHIHMDFSNVHSGWTVDASDTTTKISMTNVKQLMWSFISINRGDASDTLLSAEEEFSMIITNWTVQGALDIGSQPVSNAHIYGLADDYDDNYNVTPERYINYFYNKGFRDYIDFYVGASHYYAQEKVDGAFIQTKDFKLNNAAKCWLDSFMKQAKKKGFQVIFAVSMESLGIRTSWRQKTYDGVYAASGWTPPTYFCSFTNSDVIAYYKAYVIALADIQNKYSQIPIIQMGEPWWWSQNDKPCFYDDATKNLYKAEKGTDLPTYQTTNDSYVQSDLDWLGHKLGDFAIQLKTALNAKYSNGQLGILFFPPGVMDKETGDIMNGVNLPMDDWSDPKLDFMEIEDYDWVVNNDTQHFQTYNIAESIFGYSADKTHYYAGFVLTAEAFDNSVLWKRIMKAADRALYKNQLTFIWAGTQIRRDGWHLSTVVNKQVINGQDADSFSEVLCGNTIMFVNQIKSLNDIEII